MATAGSNIVLVGMPGCGKSTVGVMLAKQLSRDFVDTDILIQNAECCTLQHIVDTRGYLVLREVEERIIIGLNVHNTVIATGGSAVYSAPAMKHLCAEGRIVFMEVTMATLEARVHDYTTRGLAKRPDQSFADLFEERRILYERYADITIECSRLTHEEVCAEITARLGLA